MDRRWPALLDAVVGSLPLGVFIATPDGKVRSRQPGRPSEMGAFPSGLQTLRNALAGKASTETICSHDASGDTWIRSVATPILLEGEVLGCVAVNTDITRDHMQDEMLRKSEKLAAIGQLTSAIAHEINDPLESITNLLYLVRNACNMEEVQQYAELAEQELSRVSAITTQTLRFHRQQERPAPADLAELIGTVVPLYTGGLLAQGIAVDVKFKPASPVVCLEGEIRQVMNNLVRNAVDAMPKGGRLLVRVRPGCSFMLRKGVRITIADTGEGISPRIVEHLFKPFYTTKAVTGTGLGLWVSKGIVDKHGGVFSFRTHRGQPHGTVFSVWLPLDGESVLAALNLQGTQDNA